jgi:hypothetical protein
MRYFTCTSFILVQFCTDLWFSYYCLNHIFLFFSLILSALSRIKNSKYNMW